MSILHAIRGLNGANTINLPDAGSNKGKIFIIIGRDSITTNALTPSGGGAYHVVLNQTITIILPNSGTTVQSDGASLCVIGK